MDFMQDEIIVTGIVLYATQVGEYDKRLVVLTKERGKITIFANGARRPNSTFRAACQSFVMGSFTVTERRDAYNLSKVEVQEYFSGIPMDIEKMCYASYFSEFMSYYTREGDSCKDNLNLLYVTYKALLSDTIPLRLIRYIYEIKLMDIEGEGMQVYRCMKCGTNVTGNVEDDNSKENVKKITYFSAKVGGIVCEKCKNKLQTLHNVRKLSDTVIYTIQYILSSPISKLYSFNLKEDALEELTKIADEFRKEYVEREFKSLEILSTMI